MNALCNFWRHAAALHLWQATLFGLVVGLGIVLLPAAPARLRHFAGWLALLRFVLPASLLAPLIGFLPWVAHGGPWLPARVSALLMPAFIVSGNARGVPPAASHLPDSAVLVMIWSLGTILLLGAGMIRLARGLRAVKRHEIPFATGDRERLEALAGRVGLRPGRVTGRHVSPSGWLGVVGLFRSRVVVPEGLFAALNDEEVDLVLLHELMHVRRRDNLLRLCQAGVVCLFWFHPLVWWLDRRLRWESERACDEAVLRLTGANRVYASGLFKATRFALGLNLPGVSGMSRMRLQSRIHAVLNHPHRKDSPVKLALMVSALVGLFGLATLVASTPVASEGAGAATTPGKVGEKPADQNKAAPDRGATAPAGRILDITELDQIPIARKQSQPVYPSELRKGPVKGEVLVSWVLDEQGNVGDVKVEKSTDHRFDQASVDAVRQWKFSPGMKEGHPVKVAMKCPIVFSFTP